MYKLFLFCILIILLQLFSVVSLAQKPVISGFSPSKGNIGSTVIISGTNFSPTVTGNKVFFGSIKAQVISASSTSITTIVPPGVNFERISVLVNNLTAYSETPFIITFPGGESGFLARTFSRGLDTTVGVVSNTLAACDMDGDGDLDLIIMSYSQKVFSILKNNSTPANIKLSNFSSRYTTGASPVALCTGDLDGDGKPDIVVVNYSSNSLSVYKNLSSTDTILLQQQRALNTGNNPLNCFVADIDHDGKPDLICTNDSSNTISVFRNKSNSDSISFETKVDISTGNGPNGIVVTDLDNDGVEEVIISNSGDGSISIYSNTSSPGNISLLKKLSIANAILDEIHGVDVDQDGKVDIIGTSSTGSLISVFRNTSQPGNISFSSPQQFNSGSPTIFMAVADIDGDGNPDIAVFHNSPYFVSFFKNLSQPGNISFSDYHNFQSSNLLSNYLLADFDNDGRPDLLTGGYNTFSIFRNVINKPYISSFTPDTGGNGTKVTISGYNFSTTSQVYFGGIPVTSFVIESPDSIIAVVDSGATGDIQIVTSYGSAKNLGIGFTYIHQPILASFTPQKGNKGQEITLTGSNFTGVTSVNIGNKPALSFTIISPTVIKAIADSLPDSNYDITVSNSAGSSKLGSFYTGVTITTFYPTTASLGSTVLIKGSNFGLNASDNLVFFGPVQAKVQLASDTMLTVIVPPGIGMQPITVTKSNFTAYSNVPFMPAFKGNPNEFTDSSFIDRSDTLAKNSPVYASISDLNGDGKPDVILSNHYPPSIEVYKNTTINDSISFLSGVNYPLPYYGHGISSGDLNGDGKPDIVALSDTYGVTLERMITIFKNISTADSIILKGYDLPIGYLNEATDYSLIRDFDGDGKPDLAILSSSTLSILKNISSLDSISFAPKKDYGLIYSGTSIFTTDIDGDGKIDIIISESFDYIEVFRNISKPGQILFDKSVRIPAGFGPVSLVAADLDNDGLPELVVANMGNNNISVYRNISTPGSIRFNDRINFQQQMIIRHIAISDLDGDGRPDIAFVNGDKFIYLLKNLCTENTFSFADKKPISNPNVAGDIFISDMNNDGKPDILVNNPFGYNFSVYLNRVKNEGSQLAPLQAIGPTEFCDGGNVLLKTASIAGATYQWYKDSVAIISATDSIYTATQRGIYYVSLTTGSNISTSISIPVSIKPIPQTPILTNLGGNGLCFNKSTQLKSSAPYGIEWYKDGQLLTNVYDSTYQVQSVGTYKIRLNSNGCISEYSNEITIVSNQTPTPLISTASTTICSGDSVQINANYNSGYLYQWKINDETLFGSDSSFLTTRIGGKYSVMETENGCSETSQPVLITNQPLPDKPKITFDSNNLISSSSFGNQWYFNGVAIIGATATTYKPNSDGYYTVQVTQNGCKSISSDPYSYTAVVTGIYTIDGSHYIKLSPNPVIDVIKLDFHLASGTSINIDIIDINGRVIKRLLSAKNGDYLNLSDCSRSLYLARIYNKSNQTLTVLKVVKQ